MRDGLKQLGDFLEKAEGGTQAKQKATQQQAAAGHSQYTYDQPNQGGEVIGQTTTGQPLQAVHQGPHSVQNWGDVLVVRTIPGHEQEAPKHLEHAGKHWVRAGFNPDDQTIGYHEYQPARHLMDPSLDFARESVPVDAKGVAGGLYHVAGAPQSAGGELPDEINDPHHGKLTVRGHNPDSGMTVYHKGVHHPGWSKQQPAAKDQAERQQQSTHAAGPNKPPQGIGPNVSDPAKAPPPPPPKPTPPTPQAQQPGAVPAGGGQPPRPGATPQRPLVGGASPGMLTPPASPGGASPAQGGQGLMMSGPPTAWMAHGQTGASAKPGAPTASQGPQAGPPSQTPAGTPPPPMRQTGPATPQAPAQAAPGAAPRPPVAGSPAARPAKPAEVGRKPFGKSLGLEALGDWMQKAKYIKREGTPGNYRYTYAKEGAQATASSGQESEKRPMVAQVPVKPGPMTADEPKIDWEARADYHAREIQAIKKRLRERHGIVTNRYLGLGAEAANKLRAQLEQHRVAWEAARNQKHPDRQELENRVAALKKSDKMHGGLADKKSPKDFDRTALAEGQQVEMEHTDNAAVAREIAMDHLTEDPNYYKKLARMEAGDSEKSLRKSDVDATIESFFQRNPHPDDSDVHALAERLGMNPHQLETRIYALMGKRLSKCGMTKGELTPGKARQILHDKEVHGHPLTEQQRKYFGAVASGSARKSMENGTMSTGLEALSSYLRKSAEDPMPDDKCKLGYNKSKELGGSADGGELAGKTRDFAGDRVGDAKGGSGGKDGTAGIGASSPAKSVRMGVGAGTPEDVGGNPSVPEEELNDEERAPDKQMTDGKTALEEEVRQKSLTPAAQREMVAYQHARKVSDLTKSRDVRVGVPDHPYLMSSLGDVDSATESLLKSEYSGPAPSLTPPGTILRTHVMCKSDACGTQYPAIFTCCPQCGQGQTVNRLLPQAGYVGGATAMRLEKSACDPILKPIPVEGDLLVGAPENPVVFRQRR